MGIRTLVKLASRYEMKYREMLIKMYEVRVVLPFWLDERSREYL